MSIITDKISLEAVLEVEAEEDERLMQRAVRDALRRHKALGQPVVVWKDGKTVWLQPDEIEVIPEEEEEDLIPAPSQTKGAARPVEG